MDNKSELNEFLKKIQLLDRCGLKLIAVVSMVVDHVGTIFFEDASWLRCAGRLAMPIFCFFVAEGYYHTKDRLKYLTRMGIFALVSELPFDLAFYGVPLYLNHQNVMFTFFLAMLGMFAYQEIMTRKTDNVGKIIGVISVLICGLIAIFLKTDYNAFGVALVFIFFVFKDRGLLIQNVVALMYQFVARGVGIQAWAMLSAVPLMMYNGEKGRSLKWFFYCFYPGHLLILYLINQFI